MKKSVLALSLMLFTSSALAAVVGKSVTYRAGNETLKGYLAYDDTARGKRPGVLVVPEWWGVNDYAMKRARMLAEQGYVALVVDMYGRGQTADTPKDAGALAGAVNRDAQTALARFRAAHRFLDRQPNVKPERTAALGYCFGGGVVLNMARLGEPLQAVASYHGVLASEIPVKRGEIKGRVAVFNGDADPLVPPEQVEAFKQEMRDAGVDLSFVGYPGVKHTFTNREADSYAAQFGLPLKYDPAADADSWAKTLELLKASLK